MRKQITALRARMREAGADAYLALSSDYHASEYLSEHFQLRAYLSGFTGSNGALAVTPAEAALFTDGRYFLQAERELAGSGISLMRMGEEGVPTLEEYLALRVKRGGRLAVDGRTLSQAQAEALLSALGVELMHEGELAPWPDRPPLPNRPVWALEVRYAGMEASEKLEELRQVMALEGATSHLLTTLDDIAWLFNLRGDDVRFTPVALAYAYITMDQALLFIGDERLTQSARQALAACGARALPYEDVYALRLAKEDRVLLSREQVNHTLYRHVAAQVQIIDGTNPTLYRKSVKNCAEQENMRCAHVTDGVAMARFLFWLEAEIAAGGKLTELDAANKLDALRCEGGDCLGPSFSTIAGYGENAAVVHYKPTEGTALRLCARGLFLVDSGGQYRLGTTDVTRTIALGDVDIAAKRHFTLVLKAMLAFSRLRFPRGVQGDKLDVAARAKLWQEGLDYNHGTGHGIGSCLSVHEPPVVINWRRHSAALRPGMVLSDEPGLYFEGQYGIRIENQLLVAEDPCGFLRFETLTLVPIDRRAIMPSLLTGEEKRLIDVYHARVYQAIAPHLNQEERAWLRQATAPLD